MVRVVRVLTVRCPAVRETGRLTVRRDVVRVVVVRRRLVLFVRRLEVLVRRLEVLVREVVRREDDRLERDFDFDFDFDLDLDLDRFAPARLCVRLPPERDDLSTPPMA